jgi:hypothetical protein
MPRRRIRHQLAYLYAILTGSIGLAVLVRLFMQQTQAIDLSTLLAFSLTAVIVSYFEIPLGKDNGQVRLDGPVLLGATLAGGPALGGWVSFVTGLVTSILPRYSRAGAPPHWADSAAMALLNGGRDVIATSVAWWAYRGLEGPASPTRIGTTQTLAVIILCVTFAIVRSMWLWPISALERRAAGQPLSRLTNITAVLTELLPLPVAVLTAATFVRLGWSFFLLLVYVFVGLGALARQMLVKMQELQDHVQTTELTSEITQAIAEAQPEVSALCTLAHRLCQRFAPLRKFEMGLYDNTYTQVNIQISVNNDEKLPPMRIPITPQWEWLSEQHEPQLVQGKALLDQLPFSLSPIGQEAPASALFVPLTVQGEPQEGEAAQETQVTVIGGIVISSPEPNALGERQVARIALVAGLVSKAIQKSRA